MGLSIERDHFEPSEFDRFTRRLEQSLDVLRALIERPDFGSGERSLGAELELSLMDARGRALPLNREVIDGAGDPRLTVELDRFNLECNLRHGPLAGRPFAALAAEFEDALARVRTAARPLGGRAVTIGILPTLQHADLGPTAMTDIARFRALSSVLRARRSGPFELCIQGEDPLLLRADDVTFEGAATSLQLHLRVEPARFADVFNAIQLVTPVALAAACNSPTFLGHRLWDETRVALFKQAVDDRGAFRRVAGEEPRVSFGHGWVSEGALELFRHSVQHFDPLLPVVDEIDPRDELQAGGVPSLKELRLHQGTVWSWNRPVYDPAGGGHLRIELRALPSGPSVPDMVANAAFWLGLALGLESEIRERCARTPFERVHHDFYRAAQHGLEARLHWLDLAADSAGEASARDLIPQLLPVARRGLLAAGVEEGDLEAPLAVIDERARSGIGGARWQRDRLGASSTAPSREALQDLLLCYVEHSDAGRPVHAWRD